MKMVEQSSMSRHYALVYNSRRSPRPVVRHRWTAVVVVLPNDNVVLVVLWVYASRIGTLPQILTTSLSFGRGVPRSIIESTVGMIVYSETFLAVTT